MTKYDYEPQDDIWFITDTGSSLLFFLQRKATTSHHMDNMVNKIARKEEKNPWKKSPYFPLRSPSCLAISRSYPSHLVKFHERKIHLPPLFLSHLLFKKMQLFYIKMHLSFYIWLFTQLSTKLSAQISTWLSTRLSAWLSAQLS